MKFYRNIAKAVLAVSMLTAMVACEEEAVYTPAENQTNAQVYFSNTSAGNVKASLQDTEYNVEICRVNTKGDLDVKLVATGSELLKAPASVKFANGDSIANIKVTFDANEMGYDNPQTLNIALADSAALATPYGESVFALEVVVPSPWTSLGMATYTEDILAGMFGLENYAYQVEIQENDLTPGLYRLVNPYGTAYPLNASGGYIPDSSKDYYLEIHAEDPNAVWIDQCELGIDVGYGSMSTYSLAAYNMADGATMEEIAEAGFFGTLKDGEITFPAQTLLMTLPAEGDGWYYANTSGAFSVLLPGYEKKDYSAEVQYTGIFTGIDQTTYAVANLTLGADATDVKAIVMSQDDDAAAVADALAAGELEGTAVQAGRIEVPFDGEELGSDKLQIIVAVINEGEVKTVVTSGFEYYGGSDNPWKSLGTGFYTESILSTMYNGLDKITYEVEIMENSEQPGLYRVMNPYMEGVYPYAEGGLAPAGRYLEINACDPEGVYVPLQSLGFDLGQGEISYVSEGARYLANYDMETLKENYFMGAVIEGNILLPTLIQEFDDGSSILYQGICFLGNEGYYCGGEDGFCVTLPGYEPLEKTAKVRSPFVKQLEREFVGKRFVPTVNKRLVKCNANKFSF